MAMEYFDEKIVPDLRNKFPGYSPVRLTNGSYLSSIFTSGSGFSLSMRYTDPVSPPSFSRLSASSSSLHAAGSNSEPSLSRARSVVRDLTTPSRTTSTTSPLTTPTARGQRGSGGVSSLTRKARLKTARLLKNLKRQADDYKNAVESQNKKMLELDQRIDQQNEIINQQNARLVEQEEKLAEMSRRVAENETNNLTPGGSGADGNKKSEISTSDVGDGATTEARKISAVEGDEKEEISSVDKSSVAAVKVGESSGASKSGKRTRSDECKVIKSNIIYLAHGVNFNLMHAHHVKVHVTKRERDTRSEEREVEGKSDEDFVCIFSCEQIFRSAHRYTLIWPLLF